MERKKNELLRESVELKFQKVRDTRLNLEYDWMLVLESPEDVIRYHDTVDSAKIPVAWENLTEVMQGKSHIHNTFAYYIYMSHEPGESILQTTVRAFDKVITDKIKYVQMFGKLYQNKNGGYFPHHANIEVLQETIIKSKDLFFPCYTKDNITVKMWENGTHWYAYVGDIWVTDYNGKKKFNSKEEAERAANWFLSKINEQAYAFKEE